MKKIYIIGIGMGNPETLTIGGLERIKESQGIIGAMRMVESLNTKGKLTHFAIAPGEIMEWVKAHHEFNTFAVVMSGDVGFFSGAKKLAQLMEEQDGYEVELIPGISSLQYFCSKIKTSWDNMKIISLHGKSENFINEISTHEKTFLLTDSVHTPGTICQDLVNAGLKDVNVYVGENLSYKEEKITQGVAAELEGRSFDSLSVVFVENNQRKVNPIVTHGIEDQLFTRGKVPMTKSEVRSVTLSKLQICEDDIIYDVGAGTGSVSIEMALQAAKGKVYAMEINPEAVALIHENKVNFGIMNLEVISGMAPKVFEELPPPDKVFIGGTKGNMEPILTALLKKNPNVRVAINVVAVESIGAAIEGLKNSNFDQIDIVQLCVSKGREVGDYHMMTGQNPVYILTGQGRG
ncbi:MAG: precorrin-6y C5,15-methyltransferase (decarboxylating) subunit CbiE [Anaerovoracaceae bacterium]